LKEATAVNTELNWTLRTVDTGHRLMVSARDELGALPEWVTRA
jgi:hypothetical protein